MKDCIFKRMYQLLLFSQSIKCRKHFNIIPLEENEILIFTISGFTLYFVRLVISSISMRIYCPKKDYNLYLYFLLYHEILQKYILIYHKLQQVIMSLFSCYITKYNENKISIYCILFIINYIMKYNYLIQNKGIFLFTINYNQ